MRGSMRTWMLAAAVLLAAGLGAGAYVGMTRRPAAAMAGNTIMVIRPYAMGPVWAFDDPSTGLKREALVAGMPEILNVLTKNVPHARDGFLLTFSAQQYPTAQLKLTRLRLENGGAWYRTDTPGVPAMEGWLCPSLFKYFPQPPEHLYARADEDVKPAATRP